MAALYASLSVKQTKISPVHFFAYSRRATHDPYQTWHSHTGGLSQFCNSLLTFSDLISNLWKNAPTEGQEAQLSQRDRATLRVIEYFAKSLKVIRNDTVA